MWISRGDSINAFDYAHNSSGNLDIELTQRFSSVEDARGSDFWGLLEAIKIRAESW
jgi:hypothetical protein